MANHGGSQPLCPHCSRAAQTENYTFVMSVREQRCAEAWGDFEGRFMNVSLEILPLCPSLIHPYDIRHLEFLT